MEASDLSSGVWENETESTPVLVFTSLTRIANLVKNQGMLSFSPKKKSTKDFFFSSSFFLREMWCSPIFTKFAVCVTEVKTNSVVHSVLSYHSPELRYECLSMLDLSLKYDIFATFTVVSVKCRWMQRFVKNQQKKVSIRSICTVSNVAPHTGNQNVGKMPEIDIAITYSLCLPLLHRWTLRTWRPSSPTSRWHTWPPIWRRRSWRRDALTSRRTTTSAGSSSRRRSPSAERGTGAWMSSASAELSSPVSRPNHCSWHLLLQYSGSIQV